MSTGTTNRAARRAAGATSLFAAAGVASACRGSPDWVVSAPLGVAYALLVVNTYCSIRCFGAIIPPELRTQRLLDVVLGATYLALAGSLGDPVRFAAVGALLFAVATFKYALLLGRLDAAELLARKVRVDTVGTIVSVVALVVASRGYEQAAAWGLLGLNAAANLVVLWWKPLYRVRR